MNLNVKPKGQKPWLPEELKLIKSLCGFYSLEDITNKVNKAFGSSRTSGSVSRKCHEHGFKLKLVKVVNYA